MGNYFFGPHRLSVTHSRGYWLLQWVKCLLILVFILVIVQLRIPQPHDDVPASAGLQSGHHLVPQAAPLLDILTRDDQ